MSLTSFKTILLDCIVMAVVSACIFKNLSKLVNSCVAILIFNMEFKKALLLKKGKDTTETPKKTWAVYGEGAVTDQLCQTWFVKFNAGDFSLDNVPHSGQLKLIAIKLRHYLKTINVIPRSR